MNRVGSELMSSSCVVPLMIYLTKYSSNFMDKILHGFFFHITLKWGRRVISRFVFYGSPSAVKWLQMWRYGLGSPSEAAKLFLLYRHFRCFQTLLWHSIHVTNSDRSSCSHLTTDPPVCFNQSLYICPYTFNPNWYIIYGKKGFLNT